MARLCDFKIAAHENGFIDVRELYDGTVLWLRKKNPDPETATHRRMCVDSVTNSVTIYWMTAIGETRSKTFRTAESLKEWLSPPKSERYRSA
ncbi:MAG: hypothetical protein WCE52_13000 [Candidatus Acidiferrum sp.]